MLQAKWILLLFGFYLSCSAYAQPSLDDLPPELMDQILYQVEPRDLDRLSEATKTQYSNSNTFRGKDLVHSISIVWRNPWEAKEPNRIYQWIPKILQRKASGWFLLPGSEPKKRIQALKRVIERTRYLTFPDLNYDLAKLLAEQKIRLDHLEELRIRVRSEPETHLAIRSLAQLISPQGPQKILLDLGPFTEIRNETRHADPEKIAILRNAIRPFASQIQALQISWHSTYEEEALGLISQLTHLKVFLIHMDSHWVDFKKLAPLKKLKSLMINMKYQRTKLPSLSMFPELEDFKVMHANRWWDDFDDFLLGHPTLKKLELHSLAFPPDYEDQPDHWQKLVNFPQLEHLSLVSCRVKDQDFEAISRLSRLKTLDLTYNYWIQGNGFIHLLDHPHLEEITFSQQTFPDPFQTKLEDLLGSLPNLRIVWNASFDYWLWAAIEHLF